VNADKKRMQQAFTRTFKVYVALKTQDFALMLTFMYTKFILSEASKRLFRMRIIS